MSLCLIGTCLDVHPPPASLLRTDLQLSCRDKSAPPPPHSPSAPLSRPTNAPANTPDVSLTYLSIYLSIFLSIYVIYRALSIDLSIWLCLSISVALSIHPPIHPSILKKSRPGKRDPVKRRRPRRKDLQAENWINSTKKKEERQRPLSFRLFVGSLDSAHAPRSDADKSPSREDRIHRFSSSPS